MGQYYTAVVTQGDKTTLFKPDWVKITEHSWVGNFFMDTVVSRLYNRKGRVAWVGDYTSDIMEEVVSQVNYTQVVITNAMQTVHYIITRRDILKKMKQDLYQAILKLLKEDTMKLKCL